MEEKRGTGRQDAGDREREEGGEEEEEKEEVGEEVERGGSGAYFLFSAPPPAAAPAAPAPAPAAVVTATPPRTLCWERSWLTTRWGWSGCSIMYFERDARSTQVNISSCSSSGQKRERQVKR